MTIALLLVQTESLDQRVQELAQLKGTCASTQAQLLLCKKEQLQTTDGDAIERSGDNVDVAADDASASQSDQAQHKNSGDYEYVYE